MIKAVTFDLWNTLLYDKNYGDYRIDLLNETLTEEDFPRDRHIIEAEYSSTIDFFYEVWLKEGRHMPAAKLTEFILNRLDVYLSTEVKNRLVESFEETIFIDPPPLVEDARKVLKSLYRRYKTGLISNSGVTPGRNLRTVMHNHQVLQYFKCTVFSDEVGYHKPHPIIFQKAIEELQIKPEETVHVGDLFEVDVVGAKAVGMKAIWFNTSENKYKNGGTGVTPDYEIRTLSQLTEILKSAS